MEFSLGVNIVSLAVVVLGGVGTVAVMQYMLRESKEAIESMQKRLEKHGDSIIELNTKAELAVTAKDVDEKFVSKELFRQFEKHMDQQFGGLHEVMAKILEKLDKGNRDG